MQTTQQTTQTGFTLIELMIAIAIVALLAAIGVPQYTQFVEKSRRTDATTALTKIAGQLERCYTQFNQYDDARCTFGFVSDGVAGQVTYATLAAGVDSEEGDYNVTIAAGAGGADQSYVLTAARAADGRQTNDDTCVTFTLNNLGEKGSTPPPAAGDDNPCW